LQQIILKIGLTGALSAITLFYLFFFNSDADYEKQKEIAFYLSLFLNVSIAVFIISAFALIWVYGSGG